MRTDLTPSANAQPTLRKFRGYGLFSGIAGGILVGVLISGPHFYEWPAAESLAVVFLCAAGGALIGWLCLSIAAGSIAGGGAWDAGRTERGDFSDVGDGPGGSEGGDAS